MDKMMGISTLGDGNGTDMSFFASADVAYTAGKRGFTA